LNLAGFVANPTNPVAVLSVSDENRIQGSKEQGLSVGMAIAIRLANRSGNRVRATGAMITVIHPTACSHA
jgi:hypothetical protein